MSTGPSVHSSAYAQQQHHQQDISLKELMPSEVMVNNYVDDLLQREAEMLFNIQGTFSARPDSFVGGYSNFLNNALQLYGAPPLVAQSLASLEGKRNAEYCNVATTDGNALCNARQGLYSNMTNEQLQEQWSHPYEMAPGCAKGALQR